MATMRATVCQVLSDGLLVWDQDTCQEVIVNTTGAGNFCPGDRICIRYNGVMTASIPPQISASCISCMN